jgi:acetyl esterase/lipase
MTFTPDAQVAAVLAAAFERSCPPPSPPVGDVASRRVALDAMLGYFNNQAQPVASKVDISDHGVVTPDGATLLARWYRQPSSETKAAVLYLHGGGMIVGSVPIFDGPVSRYVARTGVSMLSLEYRLAPEHPHPTPVEDAYAGRYGSWATRLSWASTPAASRSWATAPAAGSPPASRGCLPGRPRTGGGC